MRNRRASQKQVVGDGHVVSGFIPKIWQTKQRSMRGHQREEKQSEKYRGIKSVS